MNGRIVIREVIRHGLDLLLNAGKIRALLRYHKALPGMLLSGCQIRILSVSHCTQSLRNRDRILLRILHSVDPADCIRMSLADTLSPERIILSIGPDRIRIEAV